MGQGQKLRHSLATRCIPIRVTTAKDGSSLVEVLLLTSKSTGSGLVFPKVRPAFTAPLVATTDT